MATVVNNPVPVASNSDSGVGFLFGIVLLLVAGVLFFMYVVPLINNSMRGYQVNLPSKVDVNVNTPQ